MTAPTVDLRTLQHITYRGALTSCNYHCPYCAFACKPSSPQQLSHDKKALTRFRKFIAAQAFLTPISILLAPYGEALLHPFYWAEMAKISRLQTVAQISCQTNLSFPADAFLQALKAHGAHTSKIALWATFHPSMVTTERFAEKVNALSTQIQISVGAVGDPMAVSSIGALRQQLEPSIYLWINKMDGLNRLYTAEERAVFTKIDPLFSLEFSSGKNYPLCQGGKAALFVRADGAAFPCCRSRETLGNLYQSLTPIADCHGRCDCFLAYSNRRDLSEICTLGAHPQLRLPQLFPLKAVLFDVDGTVYFPNNPKRTCEAQEFLKCCHQMGMSLFPVTALTRRQAERRLGNVRNLLAGGIFAYGADIQIDAQNFHRLFTFFQPPPCPPLRTFSDEVGAYKLLVKTGTEWEQYGTVYEEEQIAVVPHDCSKQAGAQLLLQALSLQTDEVMVIGNSMVDIPLFTLIHCSIAVADAPQTVREAARWVFSPTTDFFSKRNG